MRGAPPKPLVGEEVQRGGRGIPFCLYPMSVAQSGRELVSDPWSYLINHIETLKQPEKALRDLAKAFVRQSRELFTAAENPQLASQPLLYYYSFMNLVKSWIVLERRVKLQRAYHGIREHSDNFTKAKLHLPVQSVQIERAQSGRTSIFRELLLMSGGRTLKGPETLRMRDVLSQVVGIHRAYARVSGTPERFFLLRNTRFMRCASPKHGIYLSFEINRRDLGGRQLSRVTRECGALSGMHQVQSPRPGTTYAFENDEGTIVGCRRVRPQRLEDLMTRLRPDVHAVLTREGYRYYIACCDDCRALPQVAAIYATSFYLGSVTRYHPHDFEKVREKRHGWLIDEFLRTQPIQFIYTCASHIVRKDLHLPLCAADI